MPPRTAATPRARRATAAALVVVAVLLIGAVPAAVGALVRDVYSPRGLVQAYLRALEHRDARAALALPGVRRGLDDGASRELLGRGSIQPPRDASVLRERTVGDIHRVTVAATVAGERVRSTFRLERAGTALGVFPRWRFATSPVTMLRVHVRHAHRFRIGGLTLDARAASPDPDAATDDPFEVTGDYLVFAPGRYTVAHRSALLRARPRNVTVAHPDRRAAVTVTAHPTARLTRDVSHQVDRLLASCARQKVLEPSGCPFGTRVEDRLEGDPSWSIAVAPHVTVVARDGGWAGRFSGGVARVTMRVRSLYDGSVQQVTRDVPVSGRLRRVAIGADGGVAVSLAPPG